MWRRNAREMGAPIGREVRWLVRILNASHASSALSDWDQSFCLDLDARLAEYGERLVLSDKQRQCLERIERRLIRAGRL